MSDFDSVIVDVRNLTQKDIVSRAKLENAKIMQTPPKPLSFVRHVDGQIAPEEAAKLDSIIVYDYNRLDLVAKIALDLLKEFSPVLTGEYRNAHRIVVNKPNEVRITNTVPYSRVIEIGKRGSVKLNIKNGGGQVYERVWRRLKNNPDVGNSVTVKVAFTESDGAAAIAANASHTERRTATRSAQWPTLILTAE